MSVERKNLEKFMKADNQLRDALYRCNRTLFYSCVSTLVEAIKQFKDAFSLIDTCIENEYTINLSKQCEGVCISISTNQAVHEMVTDRVFDLIAFLTDISLKEMGGEDIN